MPDPGGKVRLARPLAWEVAGIFLLLLAASISLVHFLQQRGIEKQRAEALLDAAQHANVLELNIHQALSATSALAALIRQGKGRIGDFDEVAREILALYPGVVSLQLAPGGVVRHVYPLAGNEKVLGHDLFADPQRNHEALVARDTGRLTLAGPFALLQGGQGAVGRHPVMINDALGAPRFWGFATALIRFPDILNISNFSNLERHGYRYELWRMLPAGSRQVIARSDDAPLVDAVDAKVVVPNGNWTLSVSRVAGWGDPLPYWMMLLASVVISSLMALLYWQVRQQPVLLREKVAAQTQELAESEARFHSLFERAPMAFSVTNDLDDFQATYWNQTWLETFGYAASQVQGKGGHQFGLWTHVEQRAEYIDAARQQGGVSNLEVTMRRGDGSLCLVSVSGRFIDAGGRHMLLTMYDDVTEARANERTILELNATLEMRIEGRTQELTKANADLTRTLERLRQTRKELVEAEKLASLGRLVAGVAHELNTPLGNSLTVATTLTERVREFRAQLAGGMLRRSVLDAFSNDMDQGTQLLASSLRNAADLVQDFKQVAVDQTSSQRRAFNLKTLVNEVVTLLQPQLKRTPHRIVVEVADDIEMDSYPGPLGQVFTNILQNALIHAFAEKEEGSVNITAACLDHSVLIRISDDGCGMTDEVMEKIFEPFFTTRLGSGGSGLGMNIVYTLVTAVLGGRIQVCSAPMAGSTFRIELPLVAPQSAEIRGAA